MSNPSGFARILRLAWPVLLLLAAGCAQLPPRPDAPVDPAVALGTGTETRRASSPRHSSAIRANRAFAW